MRIFEGSGVALVTPMKADGAPVTKLEELVGGKSTKEPSTVSLGTTGGHLHSQ